MGNILIIEDEEHVRKLMELVLVREGHKGDKLREQKKRLLF